MALGARFGADFTEILDALNAVDLKIKTASETAARSIPQFSRLVSEFDGTKMQASAAIMAAAIDKVGGVTRLTAAEQDRVNTTVQTAIDKYRALGQEVPPKIQLLADATRRVVNASDELVASFKGEKLKQEAATMVAAIDRVGGTTKLTAGEQAKANQVLQAYIDKAHAMGATVPPHFQNLANWTAKASTEMTLAQKASAALTGSIAQMAAGFSIGSLVNSAASAIKNFASDIVTGAGQLIELSNKTGLSTDALERFAYVGKAAGVSVDTFANAAFRLGVNIAGGDGGIRKAIEDLGLSFDVIRAMNPDQQFDAIAEALEGMIDPQERNRIGMALFDRQFKEIVPAIVEGYTKIKNAATTSGRAQLEAIDAAADALDLLKQSATTYATGVAGTWALLYQAATRSASGLMVVGMALNSFKLDTLNAIVVAQGLANSFGAHEKAARAAAVGTGDYNAALAEAKAEAAGLTDAQLDSITSALALGTSEADVAKAFGLSAAGMKQATAELKIHADVATNNARLLKAAADDAVKLQEERQRVTERSIRETEKLWADVAAMQLARSGTVMEKLKFDIQQKFDFEVAKISALDGNYTNHYDGVVAKSRAAAEKQIQDLLEHEQYSREHYARLALDAKSAYDFAMANSQSFTKEDIQQKKEAYDYAERRSNSWANSASDDMNRVGERGKKTAADVSTAVISTMNTLSMAAAASAEQIESQIKSVRTLGGEWMTAAAARQRFENGGSVTYDLTTNFGRAQVEQMNPGISEFLAQGYSLQQAMQLRMARLYHFTANVGQPDNPKPPRGTYPGYAAGGPVTGGEMVLVGERGPELFMPRTSGYIVPNAGGGGASVGSTSVTIAAGAVVVQYPIMNDPHAVNQLGRLVGDALIARMRATGVRIPSGA